MALGFTIRIYKGEKFYVARVPEFKIVTQGRTRESAKRNLKKALRLHFEVLVEYAIEHGEITI